ncbi:PP2C family protein-serine/threonine phosphatase [Virgibacillus oceani]
MDEVININVENYKDLLRSYIETQDERSLYGVEQVSKALIQNNILPEEIVNLHMRAMEDIYPDLTKDYKHSLNFLLEAMISYGLAHQEFQTLREKQVELKSEIAVAADMQNTLLGSTIPEIEGINIGVRSEPAHDLNGDYHHFSKTSDGRLEFVIADVMGKGVPAALCMSMIKYAMESYPEENKTPRSILYNLNRVVERNVEPGMFITMLYAQYFPEEKKMRYASAGHEPGFYYNAETKSFTEMETKGLILGVSPETRYQEFEQEMNEGDMVVFFTDGVTEAKDGDRFIETEELLDVIRKYIHLTAQELVDQVYKYFERLQGFELRDDFTLAVLKK